MSEQPIPDKIECLKSDAVIQIKFNRDFYQRLTLLLRFTYETHTEQELIEAAKQIEAKDIKEQWIFHYETMLYLVRGAEEYARNNNMTEEVSMEEFRKQIENDMQGQ